MRARFTLEIELDGIGCHAGALQDVACAIEEGVMANWESFDVFSMARSVKCVDFREGSND